MPKLLHIDASISGASSRTRSITRAFAEAWSARGQEFTVVARDLATCPIPHLPDAALHWPARLRASDAVLPADANALQQELIDELIAADVLLVGAPMYNYSLPSTLKAWIEHVHVPGLTADFDGQTHPLKGRPAVIVTARGGDFNEGSPMMVGADHVVPPLELVLGAGLQMELSVIATNLTLAETVPAMASLRERSRAEFDAAVDRARQLAAEL